MPDPTPEEIARIAEGLTEVQKAYLTEKAVWGKPTVWAQKRWMTRPLRNTHVVFMRLGLADRAGQILDLGLAVRAYLQERG